MNVKDAIQERRSIRKYLDKKIDRKILDQILEAGRLSHSARNMQEWKFIMVDDEDLIQKLVEGMKQDFGKQAAAMLVVCGKKESELMSSGQPRNTTDASIATAYMQLQAKELGIGSCWIGSFNPKHFNEILGVPEDMTAITLTILGYPAEDPDPRHRKPREDVISYNKF